jgi:nitrite reductase/ring-hydroxylating ferredoxin subunit
MPAAFDRPWDARPFAPPPGTRLCRLDEVPERSGHGIAFGDGKQAFEMLLVRRGGAVWGYVNQCPHFKVALNARPDDFVNIDGLIMCAWHYATFRVEDGYCIDGPCEGMALKPVPVHVDGTTVRVGERSARAQRAGAT